MPPQLDEDLSPFRSELEKRGVERIQFLVEEGLLEAAKEIDKKLQLGFFNPTGHWLDQFLTETKSMLDLKESIRTLAKVPDNVLIRGATGTGKELLAHALHGDRKGTFVEINCAGMPEHLIESELFGHMKGAFTGAVSETIGLFEQAKDGTIFLDEIGELPITLQSKLLRVVQSKCVRKVGSTETSAPIKFRLVSATHQDLQGLIKQRAFRADLYHRISTFEEFTAPLNERPHDIPLIVRSLFGPKEQVPPALMQAIQSSPLEGNVRTVQSMVRRWQVKGRV
jgi:transcriptional regulator with PAS, ATPase and Fis domain